jgi:transcriptional regulator with XRE-family HTH domain
MRQLKLTFLFLRFLMQTYVCIIGAPEHCDYISPMNAHAPVFDDQNRIYAQIGSKVFDCRKLRGLTQKDLAERVALTRASIANIESGRQKVMLHTLYQIADILGVQPSELLPPLQVRSSVDKPIDVQRLIEGRSQPEQNFIRRALQQAEKR